jgi:hypothetical protein
MSCSMRLAWIVYSNPCAASRGVADGTYCNYSNGTCAGPTCGCVTTHYIDGTVCTESKHKLINSCLIYKFPLYISEILYFPVQFSPITAPSDCKHSKQTKNTWNSKICCKIVELCLYRFCSFFLLAIVLPVLFRYTDSDYPLVSSNSSYHRQNG